MTLEEAIQQLEFDRAMILFDSLTGETLTPEIMKLQNKENYLTYIADGVAIEALKEVQQYREIGTVEECKKAVEKQIPKTINHIHQEFPKHQWKKTEDGEIDYFALSFDLYNGPECEQCGYSFCIACDPDGWDKEPCVIDEYRCPSCNAFVMKNNKFCIQCGQALKMEKMRILR